MNTRRNGQHFCKLISLTSISLFLLLPSVVIARSECDCNTTDEDVHGHKRSKEILIKYKLVALGSILTAGGIGVSIPLVGKRIEFLRPENDIFFMIKAFAAGVILSTGFVHILPDAFRVLTSPCLDNHPWREFPFAGFIAMVASIVTLMIDTWATSFYNKKHLKSTKQVENADEEGVIVEVAVVACTNEDSASSSSNVSDLLRQRIISQVLELGIVVHSLVIGMTLGSSQNVATIKPLLAALSFHQFFEGMGLGGCISQAQFKSVSTAFMAVFFSLTAPVGIAIGIGISRAYNQEKSNTSSGSGLIVEGILDSASAGILIYTALVDLLAADFMNPRVQNNIRLQLGAQVSLLLGAGCMSVLARWA